MYILPIDARDELISLVQLNNSTKLAHHKEDAMGVRKMMQAIDTIALSTPTGHIRKPTNGLRFGYYIDTGEPWRHHPPTQKRDGIIRSTVTASVAQIQSGKTTQAMAEVMRFPDAPNGLARPSSWSAEIMRANEGVCEWEGVAEFYGKASIPMHKLHLNPYDPKLGLGIDAQIAYTLNLCNHRAPTPLNDDGIMAIGAAITKMNLDPELRKKAGFTLLGELWANMRAEDAVRYLRTSFDNAMKSGIEADDDNVHTGINPATFNPFIDEQDFRRAATTVIQRLSLRLNGDCKGVFGDQSSLADILASPANVMYLGELDPKVISLVQPLIWAIRDANAADRNSPYRVDIEEHDENYRLMEDSPEYTNRLHWRVKTARAYSTYLHIIIHLLDEYMSVGDAGSAHRNKANKILKHIDQWLIGQQDINSLEFIKNYFDLPRSTVNRLPGLKRGQFLLIRGTDAPAFVQFLPTEAEKRVSRTNVANDNQTSGITHITS